MTEERRETWGRMGLWLLLVTLACPIFFVSEAPGNDFSSHLATAWLAHDGFAGGPWAAWYRFDLVPLPYWLPTLLLAPLTTLLGPPLGLQVLLAGLLAALPLALRAVERAAGREPSATATALALLAGFNWAYWLGELSFLLGLPAALWAMAAWLRLGADPRARRLAAFAAWTVAAYLAHIYALCAVLGFMAVSSLLALLGRARVSGAQWASWILPLGLFGLGAWLILGGKGAAAHQGGLVFDFAPWRLADSLALPFMITVGPRWWAAIMPAIVLGLGLLSDRRRWDLRLLGAGVGFWLLAWAGPAGLETPFGLEDIGRRFSPWGVLLLAAGLGPPRRAALRRLSWAAVGLFAVVRVGDAWRAHWRHRPVVAAIGGLVAQVPAGARVLPLLRLPTPTAADFRVHRSVNRVVYERQAYSPHVFARSGQQPLRHVRGGDHRRVDDLQISAADWAFYDFALVQVAPHTPPWAPLLAHGTQVAEAGGFRLYRLDRARAASSPATPASTAASTGGKASAGAPSGSVTSSAGPP